MLGKIEGKRRGQQRTRCLDDIIDLMDMSLHKLWVMVKNREAWCPWYCKKPDMTKRPNKKEKLNLDLLY